MTSKTGSFFLFLLLLTATCGYYPLFKIRQRHIRESVKAAIRQGIPGEKLHCIRIDPDNRQEIRWERKGKEFRYQNRMYDVVRAERFADTVYYYCIADRQESRLLSCFEKLVRPQPDAGSFGKYVLQKMMTLLLSLYFPAQTPHWPRPVLFFSAIPARPVFFCLPGFDKELIHPPDCRRNYAA